MYPNVIAIVQAFAPRPSIRVKQSDQPSVPFRKFGFVEAIEALDPVGTLGLLDPDFKVWLSFAFLNSFVFILFLFEVFMSGGGC